MRKFLGRQGSSKSIVFKNPDDTASPNKSPVSGRTVRKVRHFVVVKITFLKENPKKKMAFFMHVWVFMTRFLAFD